MGIRFSCENGHELHVKSFLAGKRGVCPKCGVKVEIPRQPGKVADAAAAISHADSSKQNNPQPDGDWFIRIPSGEQFGPADEKTFRDWVDQGRVGERCLVWREGWPNWKPAAAVLSNSSNARAKTTHGSAPPPIPKPVPRSSKPQVPTAPTVHSSETTSPVVIKEAADNANKTPAPVHIDTEWAAPRARKKSRFWLYVLLAACLFLMIPLVYVLTRA